MPDYLQVITTLPTAATARRICSVLVSKRLAACVQVIGPIESVYRWQGRVERSREWLCLVKTTRRRYNQLVTELEAIHPYDTPEIVALPITAGSKKYLVWLSEAVKPGLPPSKRCP